MDETKKTISINQAGVILFISLVAFKVCSLPAKLFATSGADFAISFLLQAIITIVLIWLICIILKNIKSKGLSDVLDKTFGKILSKFLFIILFCFFIFKLVFIDTELKLFLNTTLYTTIDYRWFLVPIVLLIGFLAIKGIRVIGRVGEILGIIGIITLMVCLILSIPNLNFKAGDLMLDSGAGPIFKGFTEGLSASGDFIFLLLVSEKIATQKDENKPKKFPKLLLWGSAALLLVSIFMFVCLFVFEQSVGSIDDAIVKIINASRGISTEFKLDGLISLLWLIMILICGGLNVFCASLCFKNLFKLKSHFWGVVFCLLPIYILNFLNDNVLKACTDFTNFILPYISAFVIVVFVLLLLILSAFKKKEFANG